MKKRVYPLAALALMTAGCVEVPRDEGIEILKNNGYTDVKKIGIVFLRKNI